MIKAIIFDWSGVLSNDWEMTYLTAMDVFEHRGIKKVSNEDFKELHDHPWPKVYAKLGLKVDMDEEYALWKDKMPKHMHTIKLFPFAEDCLRKIKAKGIKTIILSTRETNSLQKEIHGTNIEKLLDKIYSGHADKREKINDLISEQKLKKEEIIYIGDSVHDIETAKHAGVISVAVLSGYDTKEKLEKAKPNYLINTAEELPELVDQIMEKMK